MGKRIDTQIVWIIVTLIAIVMVNDFPIPQRSAQHLFCNGSMLMPSMNSSIGDLLAGIPPSHTQLLTHIISHPLRIQFSVEFRKMMSNVCVVLQTCITSRILASVAVRSQTFPTAEIVFLYTRRCSLHLLTAPITFDSQFHAAHLQSALCHPRSTPKNQAPPAAFFAVPEGAA